MTFFIFDTEELPTLHDSTGFFRYNAPALLSIKDSDHLHGRNHSIQSEVDQLLPGRIADEKY